MIFAIISGTFTLTGLKINPMLVNPPIKFCRLTDVNVAQNAPPKVINADAGSRKYIIPDTPSLDMIPNKTRIKHMIIPNKDAISTSTHPFYFLNGCVW